MKIAILGWGSLIWDPRELEICGSWQKDGPLLPIEFARVSGDGRLTLVLDSKAVNVQTLWVLSSCTDLSKARKSLATREGTSEENIGYVSIPGNDRQCRIGSDVLVKIEEWARSKEIDATIWTDLKANFEEKAKMPFNGGNVVKYLKGLETRTWCKAEEYVRRTPKQITTRIRTKLEEELGWNSRATDSLEILKKERAWPQNWRDQMLMDNAHGRTEIFMYKVKVDCKEPFWYQIPVSKDVVAIVAYDKDGNVYLVRQSRPAWAEKANGVLVLPGGGVSPDLDSENLLREAKRELKEETGYECKTIKKIATVLCSARIRSKHHIFLAEIQQRNESKPEKIETGMGLCVEPLNLNETILRFLSGEEETTGYTLTGLLIAREELKR